MHRLSASLGLLLGAVVTGNASSDTNGMIDTQPQFIGFVTQIRPTEDKHVYGWIHVESHADKLVRRHIVTISSKTLVFVRKDGTYVRTNFAAFKKKYWVQVWFAGPVKESYPIDIIALQVVLVDRPK